MKFGLLLATLCSVVTIADVCAQPTAPASNYAQIAADTRKIQNEYELMTRMGARPVVLDLVPFGGGSPDFYQRGKKADEIAFVCPNKYAGGPTRAMIVRTESGGDGGRFYHLDNCLRKE